MGGEQETKAAASEKVERQRSTIGFPYMAVDSAIELARATHDNVGRGTCEDDLERFRPDKRCVLGEEAQPLSDLGLA